MTFPVLTIIVPLTFTIPECAMRDECPIYTQSHIQPSGVSRFVRTPAGVFEGHQNRSGSGTSSHYRSSPAQRLLRERAQERTMDYRSRRNGYAPWTR